MSGVPGSPRQFSRRGSACVCLVTPAHLAANPRLVKEAGALQDAGYNVRVIAGWSAQWAAIADTDYQERAWRVERVAYGPLARRSTYLRQGVRRRASEAIWRRVRGPAWLAESALHPAVSALSALATSQSADLFIGHNLAGLVAAGRAARRTSAHLAFDAEDFHLGEIEDGREHESQRDLVRVIESRWLPLCSYLTAASPGISREVELTYGVPAPRVILNVFPRAQAPCCPQVPTVEPGPGVYWFSQTIGPYRGLETAVRAIGAASSRPHLYLRGSPAVGYVDELLNLARERGAAGRIHILPPLRPSALVRDAARFHLGLGAEVSVCRNRLIALTNKVFVYLLAGLPVLLSETPAQAKLAEEIGLAGELFPVDDHEALAASIDRLLLDSDRLSKARSSAWELGQTRFNWEIEKGKFLESVEAALEGRALG